MQLLISKDLAYFLKQNKAFSNFMVNVKKDNSNKTFGFFSWEETPQGYVYWENLFKGYISHINTKYHSAAVLTTNYNN